MFEINVDNIKNNNIEGFKQDLLELENFVEQRIGVVSKEITSAMSFSIYYNNIVISALINLFIREHNIKLNYKEIIKSMFVPEFREDYQYALKQGTRLGDLIISDEKYEIAMYEKAHYFDIKLP